MNAEKVASVSHGHDNGTYMYYGLDTERDSQYRRDYSQHAVGMGVV